MNTKKLIGYKLIKPEYEQASNALLDNNCVKWASAKNFRGYYHLTLNSETINNLKKAGVLDLWFEPIYEEEVIAESIKTTTKNEVKTKQIFTKEQEDYIKNLINNEIKKLQ